MPELPEIETISRQLAPALRGRRIARLQILDQKLKPPKMPRLNGYQIKNVYRSGKQVVISLAKAEQKLWLAFHLRMTGQMTYSAADKNYEKKHLRARFSLDKGSLLFHDTRRFGTLAVSRNDIDPSGLDPLSSQFTADKLRQMLKNCKQQIKPWLLRQDRLVGLGNYLASEILFQARLRPQRLTSRLSTTEIGRLHAATIDVVKRAIANNGTTFSDYRDADGETGSFQEFLAVYGRDGEPCRRCRTKIVRIVQQQRSTFYCPSCQKRL